MTITRSNIKNTNANRSMFNLKSHKVNVITYSLVTTSFKSTPDISRCIISTIFRLIKRHCEALA